MPYKSRPKGSTKEPRKLLEAIHTDLQSCLQLQERNMPIISLQPPSKSLSGWDQGKTETTPGAPLRGYNG